MQSCWRHVQLKGCISILFIETSQFRSIWTFKLKIIGRVPIKIFTLFVPTTKVLMSYEDKKVDLDPSHSLLTTALYIFFWIIFKQLIFTTHFISVSKFVIVDEILSGTQMKNTLNHYRISTNTILLCTKFVWFPIEIAAFLNF